MLYRLALIALLVHMSAAYTQCVHQMADNCTREINVACVRYFEECANGTVVTCKGGHIMAGPNCSNRLTEQVPRAPACSPINGYQIRLEARNVCAEMDQEVQVLAVWVAICVCLAIGMIGGAALFHRRRRRIHIHRYATESSSLLSD